MRILDEDGTLKRDLGPVGRGPDPDVLANERAMEAVVEIRNLGKQLVSAFERLDRARVVLEEHGIVFRPRFDPITAAAYMKHTAMPFWDREPTESVRAAS